MSLESNYILVDHPPRSITELAELAKVPFDPNLPIKAYVQSANKLYHQAQAYEAQHQIELAFVYLVRSARIVLDEVPSQHRDYRLLPPEYKGQIQADGRKYLEHLAPLKAKLVERYSQHLDKSHPILTSVLPSKDDSTTSRPSHVSSSSSSSSHHTNLLRRISRASEERKSKHGSGKLTQKWTLLDHPDPQPSALADSVNGDDQPSAEWELVDQPSPDKSTPAMSSAKLKSRRLMKRNSTGNEVTTCATQPSFQKCDLTWPVELGNGQGERMSVVSRIDAQITNKPCPPSSTRYHNRARQSTQVPHLNPDSSNKRSINSEPSRRNIYSDEAAYQCIDQLTSRGKLPHSSAALPSVTYDVSTDTPSAMVSSPCVPRLYNLPGRLTTSTEVAYRASFSPIPTSSKPPNAQGEHLPQSNGKFKQLFKAPLTRRLSWTPSTQNKSHTFMTAQFPVSSQSPDTVGCSTGNPLKPCQRVRKVSLGDPSTWRWPTPVFSQNPSRKEPVTKTQSKVNPASNVKPANLVSRRSPSPFRPTHVNGTNSLHLHSCTSSAQLYPSTTSAGRAEFYSARPATPHTSQIPTSVAIRHSNTRQSTSDVLPTESRDVDPQSSWPIIPSRRRQVSIHGDVTRSSSTARVSPSEPLAIAPQLRRMICPEEVVDVFVATSMPETDRGVELCGLLLGTLNNHVFTITTLLIPKQVSTADTCATTDEDEVFRFQNSRNLMTLGWIHTHPTQTCFMSSLDLHTHASYQLMLPEAVAIVCSPKQHPAVGVFRLTDPPGLQTIVGCKQLGSFHPHPEGVPLYTDADGHLLMSQRLTVKLVDLRA